MIRAVLFDLDGTLLPVDQDRFIQYYFSLLAKKLEPYGYEPNLLLDTVWNGVLAMMANDGSCTNVEAFWKVFTSVFGEGSRKDDNLFMEFYANEFQQVKGVCHPTPKADRIVKMLKRAGLKVVLATNPLFPRLATESRIGWAGMDPKDFDLCSTYEDYSLCKPNPAYFIDVAHRIGVDPEDCLMVGNDVGEDMVATKVGMKVFLLTDFMVNRKDEDISVYPHGGFDDLIQFLKRELSL